MNIRALSTTVLIASLGSFSPHAFGQDKTIAPADLAKTAMATLHAMFFMGSAEVDRDSTNFRKMSKLQDDCRAKVSADVEASPPIASADLPKALIVIKKMDEDCLTAGVAADAGLTRLRANYRFPAPG